MTSIRFYLNDEPIEVVGLAPSTTLLRFLRDHLRLTGTKEGCAEGDCGACTVALIDERLDGTGAFRSVCSCLLFLPMLDGRRVYTVEGIGASVPHPVQAHLTEALGSQCGYCTPGVTMSLFEACYRDDFDEPWKLDAQMCGNLCRCTGYRPIRDAAKAVAGLCPDDSFRAQLVSLPSRSEAQGPYSTGAATWFAPGDEAALFEILEQHPDARIVAGATDCALDVTKRWAEPTCLVSLAALPELSGITMQGAQLRVGAQVNLSDLEQFTREALPLVERMLRYFGSRQIKNRATIGGNLCTASPIGDLAPVLLALDAHVVLRSKQGERRLAMEQFFLGYRQTALAAGEYLAFVDVGQPALGTHLGCYKISKRRELDISTVSAAFAVEVAADGRISSARLAFGGMAAVPTRAKRTEASLVGLPWSEETFAVAGQTLSEELSPLSDHRGSSWYRLTVAKNLLRGFYLETREHEVQRLPHRHTATVIL